MLNENKKLKIRISNEAFDFLDDLLKFHDEYDCILLKENASSKCCKSSKIEIELNNSVASEKMDIIDGMKFCYSSNLCNVFKEITIVLKEATIYAKATTLDNSKDLKNCSSCSKNCSGCTGCKH